MAFSRFSKLRRDRNFYLFLLDLVMMGVLSLNLFLIIFDFFFERQILQQFLSAQTPAFYHWYLTEINAHFEAIDLVFVAIFLTELAIRWAVAIYQDRYHRWFFYPFVHWYDVLGCVPIGSFRFLRLLRVISVVYRLHKLELINVTRTYFYQIFYKYFTVLIEEVSDRVVVNVLGDVQKEVRAGAPVVDRILRDVVQPKKDVIAQWLSHRVQRVTSQNYSLYRSDIRHYVRRRINRAVEENQEIGAIERLPVFGSFIKVTLDRAISDIVFNVIDGAVEDLAGQEDGALIHEITDILLEAVLIEEEDETLNELAKETVWESLELIKAQVKVREWLLRDLEESEAKKVRQEALDQAHSRIRSQRR